MSGVARHQSKRRRPPKMFLVASDLKIQDQLDGTIRLLRGHLCLELESPRRNGKVELWVKVLDIGGMVKMDKQALLEIPADLTGLLEPVMEPDVRFKLYNKPHRLQQYAHLPLGSLVTVVMTNGGLAEAELRYRGPLTRGSTAVYFGVQLKGWAVGMGDSNGSYKGHQLFTCPDACGLFVSAGQLTLRRPSRDTDAERHHHPPHANNAHSPPSMHPSRIPDSNRHHAHQSNARNPPSMHSSRIPDSDRHHAHSNTHSPPSMHPSRIPDSDRHHAHSTAHSPPSMHRSRIPDSDRLHPHQSTAHSPPAAVPGVLARTAESVLASASASSLLPGVQMGQRVMFTQDEVTQMGTVVYRGLLPGKFTTECHVGLLLDNPVGSWDGTYNNHKLYSVPSPAFGHLLPLSKVTPVDSRPQKSPPPVVNPKPALKPPSLPATKAALVPVLPPFPKPALKPPNAPRPASPTHPITPPMIASPPPYQAKVALQPPPKPSVAGGPTPPSLPSTTPKPPPPPPANLKPSAKQPPPLYLSTDQSRGSNGLPGPPSPLQPEEVEFEVEAGTGGGAGFGARMETGTEMKLEVNSMVEVNDPPQYGVIRWIGRIDGIPELVAGVELDQEITAGTDGSYLGKRHFWCPSNKGLFVKLRSCRRDSRFPAPETPINQVARCNSIAFAEWGSERVEEHTPPMLGPGAREHYQGWKKGIQGHLNSCYLDASLFSLFSCCSSADSVLFCPPGPQDGPHSRTAQDLLRCEIVNPLRRYGYVCASKTMALRKLLEAETTDAGFTNQEKDPEEFLNKLFQLLRVEPLLKIRSMNNNPQECHLYQLFPPSSAPSPSSPPALSPSLSPGPLSPIPLSPLSGHMRVASVQALLEASFIHSRLKFAEAPSCLPLLMPRFGKDFKMFDAILPSLTLDITDLLDETLRQCSICQSLAQWECLQCYEDQDITPGRLKQFCSTCNTQVHTHKKRASHHPERVRTPECPWAEQWEGPLGGSRQQLELFAITCIETSHYVSFVRHGPQPTDWLFFDSMADREGGENGFNVPQVRACPEVGRYLSLSEEELSRLEPGSLKDAVRRLLCDSYMCLYHCPQISLYK